MNNVEIAGIKEVASRYVKRDMPTLKKVSEPIKEVVEDIAHQYSNPFAVLKNPSQESSVILQITKDIAAGFKL